MTTGEKMWEDFLKKVEVHEAPRDDVEKLRMKLAFLEGVIQASKILIELRTFNEA